MEKKCDVCMEECRFLEIIYYESEQQEWHCHYFDEKFDLENDNVKICRGCSSNLILRPEKIWICSECEETVKEANPELAKLDRYEDYPVVYINPHLQGLYGGPIVCPKDVPIEDVKRFTQRIEDMHHYFGDLYMADIDLFYEQGGYMQEYCVCGEFSDELNPVICTDKELFYYY